MTTVTICPHSRTRLTEWPAPRWDAPNTLKHEHLPPSTQCEHRPGVLQTLLWGLRQQWPKRLVINLWTFIALPFAGKPVLCEVKYRRKLYGKTVSVFGSLQHLPEKSAEIVTTFIWASLAAPWPGLGCPLQWWLSCPDSVPQWILWASFRLFWKYCMSGAAMVCCVESVLPSALSLSSVRPLNISWLLEGVKLNILPIYDLRSSSSLQIPS